MREEKIRRNGRKAKRLSDTNRKINLGKRLTEEKKPDNV